MDSLEKAIRTAFDKGDPLDSAYRKRVYRSALTALEKSAAANPAVTDEMAATRRDRLKDIIRNIETEFRPAVEPVARYEAPPAAPPAPDVPLEEVAPPSVAVPEAEALEDAVPHVELKDGPVPHFEARQEDEPPALEIAGEAAAPLGATAPEVDLEEDASLEVDPVSDAAPRIEALDDTAPDGDVAEPVPVPAVELEEAVAADPVTEPHVRPPDERTEPGFDSPALAEPVVEPVLDEAPSPEVRIEDAPAITPDDRDMDLSSAAVAPAVDEPAVSGARTRHRSKEAVPIEDTQLPRSRGLLLPFLIGLAILIGGGVYLFYKYGDATVATNENATPAESAAPGLRSEQQKDVGWIAVFNAGDPSTVSASAGTELEILDRDEAKSLRVNAKGSRTATVTFEVGMGIMHDLAGKQAVFDFVARAQEGKTVEISVECDFGASGGCGRQRYEVGFSPGDYLFDVQIPEGAGNSPGKIIVRPDSAGSGAFIDISELRATVPAAE